MATNETQLSDAERAQWLATFDALVARVAPRPLADIEREMAAVRQSRRTGWTRESDRHL